MSRQLAAGAVPQQISALGALGPRSVMPGKGLVQGQQCCPVATKQLKQG